MLHSLLRRGLFLTPLIALTGCDMVVMNPSGDIALQQSHLITVSTLLMLLIIVPVIFLTILFAWRYRKSNTKAKYEPDWDHSTRLELVIWGAPLLIIIVLGLLTWISTHTLDPYRPLQRLDDKRPVPANVKPLEVQVVAMDWKWLFIYPEQGVASVNELVAPVDVPVRFKITASTVMNSFYIPALAGQIYAMAGMETQLNAVINKAGVYDGFSANYSGEGFSQMRFKFHGTTAADFDKWVQKTKSSTVALDRANYTALDKPSIGDKVRHYGSVEAGLYDAIVNRCVDRNAVCIKDQMAEDATRISRKVSTASVAAERSARRMTEASTAEVCITPETKKN
ncbi:MULTISPECIES: ubiquinol oxidase subunit II [unclassified Massilia]|uniref:ubiquinol oxidase subunit II n=1 Tax=unclassified Massilia TaxID=2609279 RepID=UPI001593E6B4|nr:MULTISPECIES: ubiquinol oxidase subunit II [unclassified Massilia]NVE00106.1 ubiquinol oxidase subunit II [Massilia sp. BJB1822]UTY59710.1 ubiquinol oxidase subunit II [Massilia sp. erpn]